jgi:hypothetical protein
MMKVNRREMKVNRRERKKEKERKREWARRRCTRLVLRRLPRIVHT